MHQLTLFTPQIRTKQPNALIFGQSRETRDALMLLKGYSRAINATAPHQSHWAEMPFVGRIRVAFPSNRTANASAGSTFRGDHI